MVCYAPDFFFYIFRFEILTTKKIVGVKSNDKEDKIGKKIVCRGEGITVRVEEFFFYFYFLSFFMM
jgi:hypothetical protein